MKFAAYSTDLVSSSCKEYNDSFIMIFDCLQFSYANWFIDHTKAMFKFLQLTCAGRQYCSFIINMNFIIRTVSTITQKFADPGVRKKFRFCKDHTQEMLKIINKSVLPKEYGGDGPELCPSIKK